MYVICNEPKGLLTLIGYTITNGTYIYIYDIHTYLPVNSYYYIYGFILFMFS